MDIQKVFIHVQITKYIVFFFNQLFGLNVQKKKKNRKRVKKKHGCLIAALQPGKTFHPLYQMQ